MNVMGEDQMNSRMFRPKTPQSNNELKCSLIRLVIMFQANEAVHWSEATIVDDEHLIHLKTTYEHHDFKFALFSSNICRKDKSISISL